MHNSVLNNQEKFLRQCKLLFMYSYFSILYQYLQLRLDFGFARGFPKKLNALSRSVSAVDRSPSSSTRPALLVNVNKKPVVIISRLMLRPTHMAVSLYTTPVNTPSLLLVVCSTSKIKPIYIFFEFITWTWAMFISTPKKKVNITKLSESPPLFFRLFIYQF